MDCPLPDPGCVPVGHVPRGVGSPGHAAGNADLGVGFWSFRRHDRHLDCDPWLTARLGTAAGDLAALLRALHPADRRPLARILKPCTPAGQPAEIDVRLRADRGGGVASEPDWLRLRLRAAGGVGPGGAGTLQGLALELFDHPPVARESLPTALPAVQSLELITDALGVGVWSVDAATGEVVWGRQMRRIYGFPEDLPLAAAQALVHDHTHPDDVERMDHAMALLMSGQDAPPAMAYRLRRPDGSVRHVVGRARRGEPGSPYALFGVLMDVTEQQEAAARLREAEVARAAAEQASRAKSEFLARASHELRTPLNAILGFGEFLAADPDEPLSPTQRDRAAHVLAAAHHLEALLQDLLDVADSATGELPLQRCALALGPLVVEMGRVHAEGLRRAGVRLELDAALEAADGAVVEADPARLRRVLAQLLSNAAQTVPAGGRVRLRLIGARAGRAGVGIALDGTALTPARRSALFEPFAPPAAGSGGSSGVGLALARALCSAMGGELMAVECPGMAVELQLTLPASAASPVPVGVQVPLDLAPAPAPADGGVLPIVYVEDNEVNAILMEAIVALRPRLRLHVATCGSEGLALVERLRPSLVLIDMQLPDTDGVKLLTALRQSGRASAKRCIVVSANGMPAEIERARAAGFDDYWTKPVDVHRVLAELDAWAAAATAAASPQ